MFTIEDFSQHIKRIPSTIYSVEEGSNIRKLWELFADRIHDVDGMFDEFRLLRDIDNSSGFVLDEIGQILKEPREGRPDEIYRLYLKVAIARNHSNCSLESISNISVCLYSDSDDVKFELDEMNDNEATDRKLDGTKMFDGGDFLTPSLSKPASFVIRFTGAIRKLMVPSIMKRVLSQVKPAGVFFSVNSFFKEMFSSPLTYDRSMTSSYGNGFTSSETFGRRSSVSFKTSMLTDCAAWFDGDGVLDGDDYFNAGDNLSVMYKMTFEQRSI